MQLFSAKSQDQKNRLGSSFLWNMAATVVYAGMSTIMLWAVVRLCDVNTSGNFSLGFSAAQMLQAIGYFGVRNYQVTDTQKKYLFPEYLSLRVVTTGIMMLVVGIYAIIMGFYGEKLQIYFLLCCIKLVEAVGDVFEGLFHQYGFLELSAKSLLIRTASVILVFCISLVLLRHIIYSLLLSLLAAVISTCCITIPISHKFEPILFSKNRSQIKRLMLQCFPLFASSLLLLIINNTPKVAIDHLLDSEMQTNFGILFFPAMLVNMFSGFIFRPLLNQISNDYQHQQYTKIKRLVNRLVIMIIGMGIVGLIATHFWGISFLNWFYGVELSDYRLPLQVIMLSGIFNAVVNLIGIFLTVMRRQNLILIGYSVAVVTAILTAWGFTLWWGILGTTFSYLLSIGILAVFLYCACQKELKQVQNQKEA